jgi:hypothetical protein
MNVIRVLCQVFLVAAASGQGYDGHGHQDFDARRLQAGTFHYRESQVGRPDGESVIRVQQLMDGNTYAFSNIVDGPSSQHWRATISTDFTPLSAELTFGDGPTAHKAFQLSYQAARVTGFAATKREGSGSVDRGVDDIVAPDTVDQRIDWAAVMSRNRYTPQQQFLFHVYDPKGGNSQVVATVMGLQTIHVAAGTFQVVRIVYRISKATGTEAFEVFVNESVPRFLVKEVFPDGLTSELLKISPDM